MLSRLLALGAALLAGAAGLGAETLLVSSLGPSVGFARAAPIGLAAWIAGWALGAWWGGRRANRDGRALLLAGGAGGLFAPLCLWVLIQVGGSSLPRALASTIGAACVFLSALPSGTFLPRLARERSAPSQNGVAAGAAPGTAGISWLFAANLLGCVVGAQWIGFDLAGVWGRTAAAGAAGALAVLAGVTGWAAKRVMGEVSPPSTLAPVRAPDRGARCITPLAAGLIIAIATAWGGGLEWIGLRLAVLWLGGMQPALTAVLSASLLSLAAGAALFVWLVPRDPRGPAWILLLAVLASLWPFVGVKLVPSAATHFVQALVLVGPSLAPLGALAPVLHRALAGESGRRLGDLLLFEALGVAFGLPLLHAWVVPGLGLGRSLGLLAAVGGASALILGRAGGKAAVMAATLGLAGFIASWRLPAPALASPALSNPAFERLYFAEDECFAVSVVHDGVRAERTLLTDDFRATATGDDYLYMRALGHLPVLLHPDPDSVVVLALGTGSTVGAVARHQEVERIDVLEISRRVCDAAPWFAEVNGGVLEDAGEAARVRVHLGDGRWTLRGLTDVDVLTMEPLLPDAPFGVSLYTTEFYAIAKGALSPDGLLCQWVPPHALAAETFDAVVDAFARAFPWSGMFLFGTQLILIGGAREPVLSTTRFPAVGSELYESLRGLGLESPAGVAGRWIASGNSLDPVARPLSDGDPWILYRPRESGSAPIAYLPTNLGRLRSAERPPPAGWLAEGGDRAQARVEGLRWLRRAREAFARENAARFGRALAPDDSLPSLSEARAELARRLPREAEVLAFERSARLDSRRLTGVLALDRGLPREALMALLDAIELAPERADLHLFTALALDLLDQPPAARAAFERATELCPRILETPQGERALALGLNPARFADRSEH